MYVIITENDESPWLDETGIRYHFPSRYKETLTKNTKIIYYKGKLKNKRFIDARKHSFPHYFGYGVINEVNLDSNSTKNDYFAEIKDYYEFEMPVLAKDNGNYIEPAQDATNYWRAGVRVIDRNTFNIILLQAKYNKFLEDGFHTDELSSYEEGNKKLIYTTKYERNSKLRKQTIEEKGTTCICCNFNFEHFYGVVGKDFTHIHHIKPLHTLGGKTQLTTTADLVPICPNCHAIIHRNKQSTLSIEQLQKIIQANKN